MSTLLEEKPSNELLQLLGVSADPSADAWVVYDWTQLAEPPPRSREDYRKRIAQTLFRHGKPRDFAAIATIETSETIPTPESNNSPVNTQSLIQIEESDVVEVEVTTDRRGLLILRNQFYPGWYANIVSEAESGHQTAQKEQPIFRVNRAMQGVFVEAGISRITFRFQPHSVYLGAAISCLSWLCVACLLVWQSFTKTPK